MNKKILIVEDDPALGEALLRKMEGAGFETTLAVDGGVALEKIKTMKPDLILLDIILPTLNGYEILEAKQKDPTTKEIPVIIISNSGQPVEISRTLSLGAKDYVIKAELDIEDVLSKVKHYFDGKTTSQSGKDILKGKKILWVEDDAFLRDLVTRKLSSSECSLITVSSGEAALEMIGKEKPDVLLLDILLPGINGYDVLEKIKKEENTKNIPVILFSNFGQKTDAEKGIKLGASRFVLKAATSLDEIITVIQEVLAETLLPKKS